MGPEGGRDRALPKIGVAGTFIADGADEDEDEDEELPTQHRR